MSIQPEDLPEELKKEYGINDNKNSGFMETILKNKVKELQKQEHQLNAVVIRQLEEENKKLKDAINTVLEWAEFEVYNCPICHHAEPVKDFDYVDELKKAIAV